MKRVVIKIGSSLMSSGADIDMNFLKDIVRQIDKLTRSHIEVCMVSSGAVLTGLKVLRLSKVPSKMNRIQAIASIGQAELMHLYNKLFKKYRRVSGQVLLTWDDFQHRQRYINAKNTILSLLSDKIIPIINENDAVSTEEIKFGDNDTLSSLVAGLIGADLLLILSNVDGFYYQGEILKEVDEVSADLFKEVKKKDLFFTKGGMYSKLEAARLASTFGIKAIIANGRSKDILLKILLDKENLGTVFLPKQGISARKRWIAYSRRTKGKIIIDKGAERALVERGGSLLCQGIKAVEGDFLKDDTVIIESLDGSLVGWGLVRYSSEVLKKNLGSKLPSEVIHRDNLVLRQKGLT